jgi:hypothetical protein
MLGGVLTGSSGGGSMGNMVVKGMGGKVGGVDSGRWHGVAGARNKKRVKKVAKQK